MGQTDSHPQRQKQAEYRRKVHQNAQNENQRPKSNDGGKRGRAPQNQKPAAKISKPTAQQKAALNAVNGCMITADSAPVQLSLEDQRVLLMLDNAVDNEKLESMIASTHIRQDSTHTYESLFAPYMGSELTVIRIGEPYLQQFYQMRNFVNFIECCVVNAPSLRVIKLETKMGDNPEEQKKNLKDVEESLKMKKIAFIVEYTDIHDRKIALNTNILFKLGCGLHFYQKARPESLSLKFYLGMSDQRLRLCKDTTVGVFRFQY